MGRFHAETLAALPGVEVAAIADPHEPTARAVAEAVRAPWNTDPAAVASGGYDGVVIASPDHTHAELTLAALAAGSRVLCEKPLAHDLDTARTVLDAELALGVRRVQLGFMREVDPAHVAMADQLAGLGELHLLRCTHRNTNAEIRSAETVIVQSLIHDLHTVRWLGGDITEVDARVVPRGDEGLLHVLLVCRLASGATAVIEFSDDTYAYEVEVEATAAGGMVMTAPPARPRVRIDGDHRMPIGDDWFGWFADAYRIQDRRWVESLSAEAASGPSVFDGYAAQVVADAALESIGSGTAVSVDVPATPGLYLR